MGRVSKKVIAIAQNKFLTNLVGISLTLACSNDTQFGGTANVSLAKKKLSNDALSAVSAAEVASEITNASGLAAQLPLEQASEIVVALANDRDSGVSEGTSSQTESKNIIAIDLGEQISGNEAKNETVTQKNTDQGTTTEQSQEIENKVVVTEEKKLEEKHEVENKVVAIEEKKSEEKHEVENKVVAIEEKKSEEKHEVENKMEFKEVILVKEEKKEERKEEKTAEQKYESSDKVASRDEDKCGSKDDDQRKLASSDFEKSANKDEDESDSKFASHEDHKSGSIKDNKQDDDSKNTSSNHASASMSTDGLSKLSLIYDSSNCSKTTPYQFFLKVAEGRSLPAQLKSAMFGYIDSKGIARKLSSEQFEIKYDSGACQTKNGSRVAVWVLELKSDARMVANELFGQLK